ncbi:hypothetical protein [Salmonella enterica]|uniref:hypothetical protein n=1 Tax=Salmonella enterica TaxID=28901 RepID=UPI0013B3EA61|nr:hypothetical protein [Salmonella enterica]
MLMPQRGCPAGHNGGFGHDGSPVLTVVEVRTEAGRGWRWKWWKRGHGGKGRMVVMAVTGELVVMVETVDMEE